MEETKPGLEQKVDDLVEIVTHISNHMVVKEDLERFATKEDLQKCATKEDLKKCATKEDLGRFATKEDLEQLKWHIDGMETRLVSKSYLDDKLADLGAEIGERLNRRMERNTDFHQGTVDIFERHKIGDGDELSHLRGLI